MKSSYHEGSVYHPQHRMKKPVEPCSQPSLDTLVPAAIREMDAGRADGVAVNELAAALLNPLRAFMTDKGWGLDDPERAASEALSLVVSSLDGFDPARGTFMAWVWGLARNHLMHLLRERRTEQDELSRATKYEIKHAARHHLPSVAPEERGRLLAALLSLEEDDYQLLFLLFIERMNATEAAKTLGRSAASVRKRKERLLADLRLISVSRATADSNAE